MAVALEAVDLAALLAEAVAWALLTVLVILLAKLVSVMHFKIDLAVASFEPLGWLADALSSYILTGAEEARKGVEGAMKATYDGLVWSFDEMLAIFTDLADATKGAFLYLWQHALLPAIHAIADPIRKLAAKAEAEVVSLATTVGRNLVTAEKYAEDVGWKRLGDAEAFTRREVAAARADAAAGITRISDYVHTAEAGAIALPGTITADFGSLWDELRKHIDAKNLLDLLGAGLLTGMLVRVMAQASGLDNSECQGKHKQICGTDPSQWAKLLEGLALLGVAFDFKLLYDFAETIIVDVGELVIAVEDKAWSEFS